MRQYIINRLLILFPVLFLVSVIVFSLLHMIPGDPVDFIFATEDLTDPSVREDFERILGLDKPLHVQYLVWLGGVLIGDFGESIHYQRSNMELIVERFPATILLTIFSTVVSILISIPAGVIAAIRRNTPSDYTAMSFALLGISIPNFWLGILLILAFSLYFPILPSSGYEASLTSPHQDVFW